MSLLQALLDEQFRTDTGRGFVDVANRGAVAGVLGAPVDLMTLALRPLGFRDAAPVMGSEWIGRQMERAGLVSRERRPAAEALASMLDPATVPAAAAAKLPALAMAMSQFGKNKLLEALQAGQGSGTFRLGDVTPGQLNALQRAGLPAGTSADVMVTDDAVRHLVDARLLRDGFTPEDVVRFAGQAMEKRSNVARDPAGAGHKAALVNEGLVDAETKRRYAAQMPLKEADDQLQVVTVVPRGLPGRKKKAP